MEPVPFPLPPPQPVPNNRGHHDYLELHGGSPLAMATTTFFTASMQSLAQACFSELFVSAQWQPQIWLGLQVEGWAWWCLCRSPRAARGLC